MNESRHAGATEHGRERRARPPIVKMTKALVSTAVAQRQPKMALQLLTSGLQTVRALPAAQQFDIAVGIVEEVSEEFRGVVGRRLGWTG